MRRFQALVGPVGRHVVPLSTSVAGRRVPCPIVGGVAGGGGKLGSPRDLHTSRPSPTNYHPTAQVGDPPVNILFPKGNITFQSIYIWASFFP